MKLYYYYYYTKSSFENLYIFASKQQQLSYRLKHLVRRAHISSLKLNFTYLYTHISPAINPVEKLIRHYTCIARIFAQSHRFSLRSCAIRTLCSDFSHYHSCAEPIVTPHPYRYECTICA